MALRDDVGHQKGLQLRGGAEAFRDGIAGGEMAAVITGVRVLIRRDLRDRPPVRQEGFRAGGGFFFCRRIRQPVGGPEGGALLFAVTDPVGVVAEDGQLGFASRDAAEHGQGVVRPDVARDKAFAAVDGPNIAQNLQKADVASAMDVNACEAVYFQAFAVWLEGVEADDGGDDEQGCRRRQPFFRVP